MPIYYQPPGPHVGGRQPYAPGNLSPTVEAVQVDDPPFAERSQPPSAWWEVVVPLQLRRFVPQVSVAAADNPPFGRQQFFYSAAWPATYWQPQMPDKLPPSVLHVPEDNPPFARRLPAFHQAWWETYAPQHIYESSPGTFSTVDNPPFGPRGQSYSAWLTAYVAPQLPDKLPPSVLHVPVDDPPRSRAGTPWSPVPTAWAEPVFNLQRRFVVQGVVVGSAPFSQAWLNVIRSWQYDPGMPRLRSLLAPQLIAVPEDSPIPSHGGRTPLQIQQRAWFSGVLPDRPAHFGFRSAASPGWSVDDPPRFRAFVYPPQPPTPLQVQYPKLAQDGGAAPVSDQPRAPELLALRWWVATAPPPVSPRLLAPGIPGQSVDAPPGRAAIQPAAAHWEQRRPIVVSSQLSPGVPGQSVDDPPFVAARQPARAWYDGLYPAQLPRAGVPSQPAAADFPPVSRQSSGWSVAHWFAPYVVPQRHRPLSSSLLAVRVDDPPFDARRLGRLASIVARSQVPVPDKVYLRYVVQEGPAFTVGSLICGSIVIRPMLNALIAALPAQSGSPIAGPALGGDPDLDECD